ncbi:beta-galactosidase [Alicyclobacillus fodiniaquatilis]|uniref:beta-galactosidase n=1 Tax=Alicyclobacillus fodiniaquatilis TaxID=1661150 RepID=A0ABW4JE20_9BACL
MIYVGTNYHPHDWSQERWPVDIRLMKESGFNLVRLGHLCWDSFEPIEGNYTFDWFDEVMDLFSEAGIKVVLDIATRPAPTWLHRKHPSINITDRYRNRLNPVSRYMEDVGDPAFQKYAYRFAETLVKRYEGHPALFAFGLCNEIGCGIPTYSDEARQRFIQWLSEKYVSIERLNVAWAAQRWSRRLNRFEDAEFPVSGAVSGAPERMLDMWRFYSDEQLAYLHGLSAIVRKHAPNSREATNHWGENSALGFDYLKEYQNIFDLPGAGFYPGVNPEDTNALFGACFTIRHRIGERDHPIWCLEFQTGSFGAYAPPRGGLRMYAYLALLFGAEAICAWTWRTMLGGEEQYLYGLLDHDGTPSRKLDEFQQFAKEIENLQFVGFPYVGKPDVALAYSFESFKISEGQKPYYQTGYLDQVMQSFLALCEDNVDCNIIDLRDVEKDYKVMIVPGHCIMDEACAGNIREYVEHGGTVIMTAYSAKVDENNRVFDVPMPGRLSDVFGIRANAFERPVFHYSDMNEGGLEKQKMDLRRECPGIQMEDEMLDFPIDYYEILEPTTANVLATFTNLGQKLPAVTNNFYGKGRAVYVAVPATLELIRALLRYFYKELEITPGPDTPHGVIARQIGDTIVYVNTTPSTQMVSTPVSMNETLQGPSQGASLELEPYGVKVLKGRGEHTSLTNSNALLDASIGLDLVNLEV